MRIIHGNRCTGKTTRLIKKASVDRNSVIVCINMRECNRVFHYAQKIDCNINFPVTLEEILHRPCRYRTLHIDNMDVLLKGLLRSYNIETATISESVDTIKDVISRKKKRRVEMLRKARGIK